LSPFNEEVQKPYQVGSELNATVTLDLVRQLCDELNESGLSYCHWKSNNALERSASGENDLDLLVSRSDVQHFTEILYRLGFKQAREHEVRQMPGILDYYGCDCGTGSMVHVHAHYQLILGHDSTKNYHIPLEKPYLASALQDGLFKVPAPEFELIIFVLRMMLKHFTWDTLLLHQGHLSTSEQGEMDFLSRRASESVVHEILKEYLPYLPPQLFTSCVRMLGSDCPLWERIMLGQKLLGCLNLFARRPQIIDSGLKFWRRVAWPVQRRVFHKQNRKLVSNGGMMVAIVGGDGAGKTTVIDAMYKWLSHDFEVFSFHMGKPQWSALTYFVRGILKVGRSLGLYPFMQAEIRYTKDADLLTFPGYPWLIRELCTARDRFLTYGKACRYATNGGIVILDRFPLPQIKFMDGPQIERMTGSVPNNRLIQFLNLLEQRYYRKMILPDLLIVLCTDPEIAVRRKTDEAEASVRARSTEIWEIDWSKTPAHVINASHSKDEVLSEVRGIIWSRL